MGGPEVEHLIGLLAKLPGMGPRSARRAALRMLQHPEARMLPLASALAEAARTVKSCADCGNLDSRAGAEILEFMRRAVKEFGQTIVMVTHDPNAAGHADRIVFLADGHIVDEMQDPTADKVLDRMKRFGE